MTKERNEKIFKYCIISIIFFISFIFMWNRTKYGYIYNDEPFILTLAHRLIKGDIFLWDEWQPAQLSSYLNYPLFKIYFLFNNDTDGIILGFRHVYIVLWFIVVFYLFVKYSKVSKHVFLSCFASLYLFFFSSLDLLTVSYNFYSLSGILISYTLFCTYTHNFELILSGIFFSIATLACPYLAIIFIIYYLYLIIINFYKKITKKYNYDSYNSLRHKSLFFLYGVIISVILFLAFFFRHGGTLAKAIDTLPIILNDSEYPSRSIIQLITGYFIDFVKSFKVFICIFLVCILASILCKKRKELFFEAHCILFLLEAYLLITWYKYALNFMVVPICFLGLHALLIGFEKCNKKYKQLYFIGFLFSFILYSTSDLREIAIAMGLLISGFSSFFLIYEFICDYCSINMFLRKTLMFLIVIAQLFVQVHFRLFRYYHNRQLSENIYKLVNGPAKGIYVNEEKKEYYEKILEDFDENIPHRSKILIVSMDPWLYLYNDGEYCTYSAWMVGASEYRISQLQLYYELHPEKIPDYVYVKKADYSESLKNSLFFDYDVKETEIAYILIKE